MFSFLIISILIIEERVFVEHSFHYLLMANQAMIHKRLLMGLKDTCLTLGQPKILEYLAQHDGASQKEIAAACYIEAATLTSVLNRMEEKKLVERRMPPGDRRTYHIYLTDLGRTLSGRVEDTFAALENVSFDGVSDEERDTFLRVFETICHNLSTKEH